MMEGVPSYVLIVFVLTTIAAIGILFQAVKLRAANSPGAKLLFFAVSFWFILQGILGIGGFFRNAGSFPPRVFSVGVLPAILFIAVLFIFFRRDLIERLSLKTLTLLHLIRVPVEIVLLWLFQAGVVPQLMTFEGRNFDILSGITAPIIYFFAFRERGVNRTLLIVWNLVALLLLFNIVSIAALSLPSPMQKLALDQPNIAVTFFPYNWLPSVVVPIVLFAHLASLWILFKRRDLSAN
jgi:hypothetical protein